MKDRFASWKEKLQGKKRFALPTPRTPKNVSGNGSNDVVTEIAGVNPPPPKPEVGAEEQHLPHPKESSPKSTARRLFSFRPKQPIRNEAESPETETNTNKHADTSSVPAQEEVEEEEDDIFNFEKTGTHDSSSSASVENGHDNEDFLAPIGFVGKFRSDTTPLFTKVESELSVINEEDETVVTTGIREQESLQSDEPEAQEEGFNLIKQSSSIRSNNSKIGAEQTTTKEIKWLTLVHKNIECQRESNEKNVEVSVDRKNVLGAALKIALQQDPSLRDEGSTSCSSRGPTPTPSFGDEDYEDEELQPEEQREENETTGLGKPGLYERSENEDLYFGNGLEGLEKWIDQTLSISREEKAEMENHVDIEAPSQPPISDNYSFSGVESVGSELLRLVSTSRSASIGSDIASSIGSDIAKFVSELTSSPSSTPPESDLEKIVTLNIASSTEMAGLSPIVRTENATQDGGKLGVRNCTIDGSLNKTNTVEEDRSISTRSTLEGRFSPNSTWDEIEVSMTEVSKTETSKSVSQAPSSDQDSTVSVVSELKISEVIMDDDKETLWIAVKQPPSTDITKLERSLYKTIKNCKKKKKPWHSEKRLPWKKKRSHTTSVQRTDEKKNDKQLVPSTSRDIVQIETHSVAATLGAVVAAPSAAAAPATGPDPTKPITEASWLSGEGQKIMALLGISDEAKSLSEDITEARIEANLDLVKAMKDLEFGKGLKSDATQLSKQLEGLIGENSWMSPTNQDQEVIASIRSRVCAMTNFVSDGDHLDLNGPLTSSQVRPMKEPMQTGSDATYYTSSRQIAQAPGSITGINSDQSEIEIVYVSRNEFVISNETLTLPDHFRGDFPMNKDPLNRDNADTEEAEVQANQLDSALPEIDEERTLDDFVDRKGAGEGVESAEMRQEDAQFEAADPREVEEDVAVRDLECTKEKASAKRETENATIGRLPLSGSAPEDIHPLASTEVAKGVLVSLQSMNYESKDVPVPLVNVE